MSLKTVGVIGSGAWGTALAHIISTAGNDVMLWGRNSKTINDINTKHENTIYLKGLKLNSNIKATSKIEDVCKTDVLVFAVPAQQIRSITNNIQKVLSYIALTISIILLIGLIIYKIYHIYKIYQI